MLLTPYSDTKRYCAKGRGSAPPPPVCSHSSSPSCCRSLIPLTHRGRKKKNIPNPFGRQQLQIVDVIRRFRQGPRTTRRDVLTNCPPARQRGVGKDRDRRGGQPNGFPALKIRLRDPKKIRSGLALGGKGDPKLEITARRFKISIVKRLKGSYVGL